LEIFESPFRDAARRRRAELWQNSSGVFAHAFLEKMEELRTSVTQGPGVGNWDEFAEMREIFEDLI